MNKSPKIMLSVPSIKGNELNYVTQCIKTEWVSTAGKCVDLFEKKIAKFTGAKYAISCINGTAALQLALKLAGVKFDDEVIVPTITFIAPINAVRYNGANPIFMDSDKYFTLNIDKTIQFILKETTFKNGFTYNKKTKKRVSAILPVHVWGNAVWLDEILPLCKKRNIAVVEDASESLGTKYSAGSFSNKHTGTIGKLGCLSFNGNKIITTGGGGMILTNDKKLAQKAYYYTTQAKDDSKRYIHNNIGFNFRLPNILAALGIGQLEKLSEFLKKKKLIHKSYLNRFKNCRYFSIAPVPDFAKNNHWLNILRIKDNKIVKERSKLIDDCNKKGIELGMVWHPNHLQRPYKNFQNYKIDNAQKMVLSSLCLPSSIQLKNKDINKIVSALKTNGK